MTDKQDDLQRLYEEASAIEGGQPASKVRTAVLAQATMLAQSRTEAASNVMTTKNAANWPNWKSGLVASVLLVPLLGILVMRSQDAPELQEQVATAPRAAAPVTSKPAAEVLPAPAVSAHAEAAVSDAAPRKAEPVKPMAAKMAKSMATAPPLSDPVLAPAPAAVVAGASPPPAFERPALQGVLGATAITESRADRAEAGVSRSRESAPMVSNLVVAPSPAAAPAKSLASARYAPSQTKEFLQAARQGDLQRVQALLNDGAALQARDAQGRSALMLAAISGHATLVKRLVELGADRAVTDSSGLTALQHAQQRGFTEIAALLE